MCKLPMCNNNKRIAAGYCSKHYQQIKSKGRVYNSVYDSRPGIDCGDYVKLPVGVNASKGYALVDKEFAYLDKYKWTLSHKGYAISNIKTDGKFKMVYLARIITNAQTGLVVDHINHDKLDNRSDNLRVCTNHENSMNQVSKKNVTGYKGVRQQKHNSLYIARIGYKMKRISLGTYKTAEEAAKAYDRAAKKLYGEFAYLNFKKEI